MLKECILDKSLESMSGYSWYRAGGTCIVYHPESQDELIKKIQGLIDCHQKYVIVGSTANILFSDNLEGIVLVSTLRIDHVVVGDEFIEFSCGCLLQDFVDALIQNNVGQAAFLSGIPGTVGGGLRMNAGAFGSEISDFIRNVTVYDPASNTIQTIDVDEIGFKYRGCGRLVGKILLSCSAGVTPDSLNGPLIKEETLRKRAIKQPLEFPSCGSVFKRPEGDYAGRLIELAGLKGFKIGGAMVSDSHANFVLNINRASGSDLVNVIEHMQKVVFSTSGVNLEKEVVIIGKLNE